MRSNTPALRDWLAEDRLAWLVIDAVAELDLNKFFASYGADGVGRDATAEWADP